MDKYALRTKTFCEKYTILMSSAFKDPIAFFLHTSGIQCESGLIQFKVSEVCHSEIFSQTVYASEVRK